MRLRMPTVKQVESEDGSCSLTYEGLDESPAQAGGGGKYLLRVSHPEGEIEVRATVQSVTSFRAEEQAKAEGLDFWAMGLAKIDKYVEEFAEKYGATSKIVTFEIDKGGNISNIAELSKTFCKMYFEIDSSYRYNNSEYPACGEGFYPDTIHFQPGFSQIDRKYYYRDFQVEEMFHD